MEETLLKTRFFNDKGVALRSRLAACPPSKADAAVGQPIVAQRFSAG